MPKDLRGLGNIWQEMMTLHQSRDIHFALDSGALQHWLKDVAVLVERDDAFVLQVSHDDVLFGFGVGWIAHNSPIYRQRQIGFVSEFAVAKEHQGQGSGSALFLGVKKWFHERKVDEFHLSTAAWNEDARQFWEAKGGKALLVHYIFDSSNQEICDE